MTISGYIANSKFIGNGVGINISILDGDFSKDFKIYNNIFNNTNNFYFNSNFGVYSKISWNTTKTLGPNILGGEYFGGNAWLKPDGYGFSQTCEDSNGDGICDSEYLLYDYGGGYVHINYLPLKYSAAAAPTPEESETINISQYVRQ